MRLLDLNASMRPFLDVIVGAKEYRLKKNSDPASVGISALTDKTITVALNRPAAYFTRLLCHHAFAPIHPSMLKVESWKPGSPIPSMVPTSLAPSRMENSSLKKSILLGQERRFHPTTGDAVCRR